MTLEPRLPPHAAATIRTFLAHHVRDSGAEGVVVGLSGGVDSALTARLATDALGPERVTGVLLPDRLFPAPLIAETQEFARGLSIAAETYSIEPVEAALRGTFPQVEEEAAWGNAKARLRMIALYTVARRRRALVVGTGNKSELLLGYFTKYGDGGVDLLPIGDLFKTQVWALGRELALPTAVLQRAPTAGLWEGQTDEAELGMAYPDLDRILHGLEQLRTAEEIAGLTGLARAEVERIERRVREFRHKRRPPPIPKVGLRTVGIDWRD